jgi:hypothetical protein
MGCEVAEQKLNNEGTKQQRLGRIYFQSAFVAWLLCCEKNSPRRRENAGQRWKHKIKSET